MAKQEIEFTMKYDPTADVLYCSFGEPRAAVSEEVEDGIVLRKDPETEQLVGMTVIDFARRFAERPNTSLSFPINAALLAATQVGA
jgi:uncharacterized protein YuzE